MLGETQDISFTPTAEALMHGVAHVWDLTPDGKTVLVSSRAMYTKPPVVGVWQVADTGRCRLVAGGWRAVTAAKLVPEGVLVAGTPPDGVSSPALYRLKPPPVEAPAEGQTETKPEENQ